MTNYIKPQTLKGFRDFLPEDALKRQYIVEKVKETFKLFGFEPLETPTLEYASLLLGKYGTEADKLVYTFKDKGEREIGLRFDQTVPTARILAQYQKQLPRFFRRYQIQNVFRAEKPQKGRYREFTQCDIDIFGSSNPLSDAEIIACTYFSFKNIGFKNVYIALNDREALIQTLKPFSSEKVSVFSIIQSMDKLGKLTQEQVIQELIEKGLDKVTADSSLRKLLSIGPSQKISEITQLAVKLGVNSTDLPFSSTLARGLDYYTGAIFEVIVEDYGSGSLGGGGRYDALIEKLGGVNIPAVGIAFGFDRIVEAAEQLGYISLTKTGTQVLVTVFSSSQLAQSIEITIVLRRSKIPTEVYIEPTDKLDKQLKYADKKGIPYAVIIGPEEVAKNVVKLKDLAKRKEIIVKEEKLPEVILSVYPEIYRR